MSRPGDDDCAYLQKLRMILLMAIEQASTSIEDGERVLDINTPMAVMALAELLALMLHISAPKGDEALDEVLASLAKYVGEKVKTMDRDKLGEQMGLVGMPSRSQP